MKRFVIMMYVVTSVFGGVTLSVALSSSWLFTMRF